MIVEIKEIDKPFMKAYDALSSKHLKNSTPENWPSAQEQADWWTEYNAKLLPELPVGHTGQADWSHIEFENQTAFDSFVAQWS